MKVSQPVERRRQVDRSAASTAAMLDAAIELIVEQGTNVSMMAIGQRSGFSHGLVMARFGSKAGLKEAVAREAQRRFAETVVAASAEVAGIAKLHRSVDVFFLSRLPVSQAFYILLGAALGPDPELRAAFRQADKAFRRYIELHLREAQALGEVHPSVDVVAAATLLVGMLRGVALQYCIDPKAFEMEPVAAQAHALISSLGTAQSVEYPVVSIARDAG